LRFRVRVRVRVRVKVRVRVRAGVSVNTFSIKRVFDQAAVAALKSIRLVHMEISYLLESWNLVACYKVVILNIK